MADDNDNFFSDDDLNDIPANTLDQLEHHAFTSTQKPASTPTPSVQPFRRPVPKNKYLPWRPPQPSRLVQQQQRPSAPPPSAPEPPSFDYGYGDEDVIDLDEPSMVIQSAARATSVRPNQRPQSKGTKAALDPETEAAFAAADAELGSQTFGRWPRPAPAVQAQDDGSIDVSALQARIAELEAEQARSRQSEQEALNEARAKQGEISIVRSNQDKLTKQYEARLSVMQKLHADETAKQRAEIEASRKEREKMQTDNRFLQHDLAQEAERVKRVTGPKKPTQRETPKKSKRTALGDGFDEHELQASPSKTRDKSRDHTPKVGAKRKRTANDSPVAALSFTQPPQPVLRQESTEQTTVSFDQPVAETLSVSRNDKYEFMQLILHHSPPDGQCRTIELLAGFHFPSKPNRSLSTILLDSITYQTDVVDGMMALVVSRALLDIWHRCLEEQYMTPCYLIVDMLHFVLQDELLSTKASLIEQAIPLCSRSIDLISVPLGRASRNASFAASLDRQALEKLANDLDVDGIVDLLHQFCQAASLSSERNETFWRTIEFTFVMLTLNKAQPMHQIITVLQMLITSARSTTFSVIVEDPVKQVEQEKQMVDRLTNLLFENPDPPKDEPPYGEEEVLEMRVEVLKVLREMCQTDHGTLLLMQHRSAIGRLVRFLDVQVNKLYRTRPSMGLQKKDEEERSVHEWVFKPVNMTTRLLYHLLRGFDDPPAAVQKLHAVHGGYHKFLVSLTRIAFSEQLVFEAGIEDEAAEAAHNILDNILGPEDGEAVMKAMETPRGTKGSTTERNTTSAEENGGQSQGEGDTTMTEPG
ncbi:hypothetical protein M409DRAFT_70916 [Zasmidium cellare ATCC 36951]|uniref:DNA repair protein Rad26 n=1 Tax=Zasmidium cellare ATCC 36951 TaxID=1080233 RepID=A0A6A6BXS8_ZASCE|nr:uncharacterized protein M409DRAFT_70916 [Zasmidium cellare ATCC 36951]KAF2159601.1 hypothetical protein M409DRAFT_70916 [Zasmidium cellare ATCC 36951]